MTITLTQLTDLQRVRLALSSITVDGTVHVERSSDISQLHWQTVRGGVALPVLAGSAQLDDYEWPDGLTSHYRVLPVDPPAGLLLTGVSGDYASTPDTAALDVANELRFGIDLQLADWNPGSNSYLFSKYDFNADQRSYALRIDTAGNLDLLISSNATSFSTAATAAVPVEDGERVAIRGTVSIDDTTGDYTAVLESAPTRDGPWTLIGSGSGTLSGTALHAGTAPLVVGAASDGTAPAGVGTVFSAWVEDTEVLVADVRFDQQTDGDTSFVDDAGLTWTVNGNAHIVGAVLETDSIAPTLGGQIWLKSIQHPSLNQPVTVTDWSTISRAARGGLFPVKGRSLPVEVSDRRGSRGFDLELMTDTPNAELVMDAVLAFGGPMFVHLPAACPVPGGYVSIGNTTQARRTRSARSPRRYFTLPCTVVAAPAADVVGTTVIWGTIFDLYGDWNAVYAAHPAYRGSGGLLELVGSPDDLFVP